MRPGRIVLCGATAAILVTVAVLLGGSAAPDGTLPPHLPLAAVALTLIGFYALAAIVLTAGRLIAAALGLRRSLGRTNAAGGATWALEWLAAWNTTALRALAPQPVGATPQSARGGPTILLDGRFDPGAARAEATHAYYIGLARTHALGALVGLGAIAALGFAQALGGVPFPPSPIPIGAAVLALAGLLLIVLLGRFAIDVAIEPLVDALARLPWEEANSGRLRQAIDLLRTAGIDAATSGRSVAAVPGETPERLAAALEDGNRALAAAAEQLAGATEALGAAEERLAGVLADDRRAINDAVDRLAATADALRVATRSAAEGLQATLRDAMPSPRTAAGAGATAIIAAPEPAAQTPRTRRPAAAGDSAAPPNIGDELRKLLQEI